MDIDIQGHNLRVSDALNSYVRKKLEKLDRYLPNITEVRVELGREHTRRGEDLAVAQITVRHRRGAILRAQENPARRDRSRAQPGGGQDVSSNSAVQRQAHPQGTRAFQRDRRGTEHRRSDPGA